MTDEAKTQADELFAALVASGADKNKIIRELADKLFEGDITQAFREYNKQARAAGLILGTKERTAKANELIEAAVEANELDLADDEVRSDLAEQIADEFDISKATAMQHVRDYCAANDIELPTLSRTPFKEVMEFIVADRDAGVDRKDTNVKVSEKFGITVDSADSTYSRVLKELGLTSSRGAKCDIAVLVKAIRENKDKPKAEAVKAVSEITGYSEATTKSFFGMVNFAEAWHAAETGE